VNPTLVNNVETLSNVPHILARGAEWFRGFGTEGSPGIIVCTVVGDVVRDGVGEVEMGVTLSDAIDRIGGGVPAGRTIKAVFSGVSNPVLVDADLDTPLTYEDFASAGSGLGAAGFIVYDDTTCVVELALLLSRFLYIESCGQCPACKLGTQAITEALVNLQEGQGSELDIEIIGARLRNVTDGNRCALPIEEQNVVSSLLRHFAEEFVEHLEGRGCTSERELVVPKLVDIVDGRAVYDEHYRFKLPDWTYADGTPPEA
jgi:NADH:ubiquinone oxidoreductase subunit F (NADH-binding)